MQDIWVAIIGGICVAVPSILATVSSNKKTTSLMLYRIEQLEKKQDKHNTLIERTYKLEEDVKLMKEEIFK
jgi:hypothetical protein|nr:MAG TPA: hypothetical protein [Caudoviricetes sp.]